MFKSRIWKWGLDKKLKSDEVLAIMILKRDRDAQHKPSQFTIRGQPVDLDNINRYVKRNPSLLARMRAGEAPSVQTSIEVACHTPPPSPTMSLPPNPQAQPQPPREVYRTEELLTLFRDYIDGSFTAMHWDWKYNVYCEGRAMGDRSEELFERVLTSFAMVNHSLMRGDQVSVEGILNPAFESFKEIVSAESPLFVVRTVCLLWYLERHYKNDLLRLVMNYLGSLVPIVLGQHHILARIWHVLCTTPFTDYYELSSCLYSMLVPLLEERIGPANYLMAMLYSDHIDCVVQRDADALPVATRYRARADATGHRHPWLVELAVTQTAVLCRQHEADGRFHEAMEHLRNLKTYDLAEEQDAAIDVQMGNYFFRLGDLPSAVAAYRRATRTVVATGSDERLLKSCLNNLETALVRQGWAYEASRVHQYRLARTADFAADTSGFVKAVPGAIPESDPRPYNRDSHIPIVPNYTGELDQRYAEQDASWLWKGGSVQEPYRHSHSAKEEVIPVPHHPSQQHQHQQPHHPSHPPPQALRPQPHHAQHPSHHPQIMSTPVAAESWVGMPPAVVGDEEWMAPHSQMVSGVGQYPGMTVVSQGVISQPDINYGWQQTHSYQ